MSLLAVFVFSTPEAWTYVALPDSSAAPRGIFRFFRDSCDNRWPW